MIETIKAKQSLVKCPFCPHKKDKSEMFYANDVSICYTCVKNIFRIITPEKRQMG